MGQVGTLRRLSAGAVTITAVMLLALFASTLAGAAKVEPVLLEGASNDGKDCADNVGSGQTWTQLKVDIDPLVDGVYSDGTLTVTISNAQNDKTFDWSSNIGVDAVVVKGGSDGAYLYRYDPPSETTSDSGLTTPGQNAISHVNFCYDVAQPPAKGTIIVEKQLDPDGYQPPQGGFPFSGAIQAVLGDGQTAQAEVDPGTYTVTESLAGRPFWDLTSLQCNDGNSSGDLATLTATYRVEAGETVRCVFTNTKRSLIIVKKLTNPAGAQQSFAFDASYDQDGFSLSHGQQNVSDPLLPGSYSVTEHSTPGWQLQSATCDNGDDPGDIDLPASVTVTCTFTNAPAPPKLTPTVVTDVHNADHQVVTQAAIGSSVHDSATVSGSGATPTGSVDFRVYLGNLQCSGEGSAAGTVALDGSGVAHPSNSAVVPAGGLSFRGHYSGDAVYTAGDGPCETLAATQLTPTVVTDVHNADHQVVTQAAIGSSVHDSATVSGSGATPTGSVDFRVYLGNLQCSGEGSAAGTVALDGSGVAHPSNSAVVPAGGLSFRGHYSGDAVYTAGDGPCETLAATQLTVGKGSINVEK